MMLPVIITVRPGIAAAAERGPITNPAKGALT
jgi:hypothetical protein